jgi:hypothetical protein
MKPGTSIVIGAAFALIGLVGCATPFRAPPDVTHIELERSDSAKVFIPNIWLERKQGHLAVAGYVQAFYPIEDTTDTHLDVILYDKTGAVLRTTIGTFEPQRIVRRPKHPPLGTYRVVLDPLPQATTRIAVRAHQGIHPIPRHDKS